MPFGFIRTSETVVWGRVAFTRAPPRFRPRINKRTGLTVWLLHHEGGSTLVIAGPFACGCAKQAEAAIRISNERQANFGALPAIRFGPEGALDLQVSALELSHITDQQTDICAR